MGNIGLFILYLFIVIFLTGGSCLIIFIYIVVIFLTGVSCLNIVGVVVIPMIWWLDLQLPVQSMPISNKVVCLNFVHGEVYSVQLYVMKVVNELRLFGVFFRFPPPIKLTTTI